MTFVETLCLSAIVVPLEEMWEVFELFFGIFTLVVDIVSLRIELEISYGDVISSNKFKFMAFNPFIDYFVNSSEFGFSLGATSFVILAWFLACNSWENDWNKSANASSSIRLSNEI